MNEAYIKPLQAEADKLLERLGSGRFEDPPGHPTAREVVAERKGILKALKVLREGPAVDLKVIERSISGGGF